LAGPPWRRSASRPSDTTFTRFARCSARHRPSLHREGERLPGTARYPWRGPSRRMGRGCWVWPRWRKVWNCARAGSAFPSSWAGGRRPAAGAEAHAHGLRRSCSTWADRLSRPRGGDGRASLPGAPQGRHGDGAARTASSEAMEAAFAAHVDSRAADGRVDDASLVCGRSRGGGPGVHCGASWPPSGECSPPCGSVRGRRGGPRAEQRGDPPVPRRAVRLVRAGITLYGCSPLPPGDASPDLRPVMRIVTKVLSLKELPPGHAVSYNRRVPLPTGPDGSPSSPSVRRRLPPRVDRPCPDVVAGHPVPGSSEGVHGPHDDRRHRGAGVEIGTDVK